MTVHCTFMADIEKQDSLIYIYHARSKSNTIKNNYSIVPATMFLEKA